MKPKTPQTLLDFFFPQLDWLTMNRLIRSLRLEGNGADYDLVVEGSESRTDEWSHPEDPLHKKDNHLASEIGRSRLVFPKTLELAE